MEDKKKLTDNTVLRFINRFVEVKNFEGQMFRGILKISDFDTAKNCAIYRIDDEDNLPAAYFRAEELMSISPRGRLSKEQAGEAVNHPAHYTEGKFETIDIIQDKLTEEQFEGFCVGNVIKYLTRYQLKGGIEDLKKGRWYLNKIIEVKENGRTADNV